MQDNKLRELTKDIQQYLRVSTRTVAELNTEFNKDGSIKDFEKAILRPMQIDGVIDCDDFGIVSLTKETVKVLNLADKEKQKAATVKSNIYKPSKENYVPVELGQTCLRPGAYDFLKCPSLIGTKRVPHVSQNS